MEVVREIEESGDTPQERSKIYGLPITTVVKWAAKYGNIQVKPRKGVFMEMKNQMAKIQQLESALADANLKVRLLEKSLEIAEKELRHSMLASMTDESHCYQNAVAERVNGILKDEFYLDSTFQDFSSASVAVHQAIQIYNQKRLHQSLNFRTPDKCFREAA